MTRLGRWLGLVAALLSGATPADDAPPADPTALPLANLRIPASAEECVVWRRERAFARSVEAHDMRAFESFLHPGAVFEAGSAEAVRGRATVASSWAEVVEGRNLVLRWRPGIVAIGGDPDVALSRGPYILKTTRNGFPAYSVGFYQTVWVRDANDPTWRVLFDASASTPRPIADRPAAEHWVMAQAMADCAAE